MSDVPCADWSGVSDSVLSQVFPVLAGVVPEAVLAVLPGSLTVTLRTVAQHSTVSWCKVSSGYVMLGHWSNMMTARTHIQQVDHVSQVGYRDMVRL